MKDITNEFIKFLETEKSFYSIKIDGGMGTGKTVQGLMISHHILKSHPEKYLAFYNYPYEISSKKYSLKKRIRNINDLNELEKDDILFLDPIALFNNSLDLKKIKNCHNAYMGFRHYNIISIILDNHFNISTFSDIYIFKRFNSFTGIYDMLIKMPILDNYLKILATLKINQALIIGDHVNFNKIGIIEMNLKDYENFHDTSFKSTYNDYKKNYFFYNNKENKENKEINHVIYKNIILCPNCLLSVKKDDKKCPACGNYFE